MAHLPVVLCLTSQGCTHCNVFRHPYGILYDEYPGTLPFVRPSQSEHLRWDAGTFGAILTGSEHVLEGAKSRIGKNVKARVYNIHFSTLSAASIVDATEFIFETDTGEVKSRKIRSIGAELPPPCALLAYAVKYPAWVFITAREWNIACSLRPGINVPGSMFAKVCGKRTVRVGYGENGVPFYKVVPSLSEYKGQTNPSFILEESARFVNGPSFIVPDAIVKEDNIEYTPPSTIDAVERWACGGFGSARVNFIK